MLLSRYEKENAVMKIDGYFLMLHPTTKPLDEFERAKDECLLHLKRQINTIESLSFEEFAKAKKKTKAWLAK